MNSNKFEVIELKSISSLQTSLNELLALCVNDGASVGFYAPAQYELMTSFWHTVETQLQAKQRRVFAILNNQNALAAVQLVPCQKQNGQHRAEIEKLIVHPKMQRQGLARKLMNSLEMHARKQGLSLLFLDTQTGDKSEFFYQALGYQKAGQIPHFVTDCEGAFSSTSYYYKQLTT